jgi:hypothetical protein
MSFSVPDTQARRRITGAIDSLRPIVVAGLVAIGALLAGCATIDIEKAFSKSKPDAPKPVRLTAIWTHTTLNQTGQIPVRGFGGRIMFYATPEGKEKGKDKPINVSGTLTVYAFDETTDGKRGAAPSRKFVFTPAELKKHYSKSMLGPSYSVWIPWDEVGGRPRRISLMVRFAPTEGGVVVSESSLHLLPGVPDESHEETRAMAKKPPLKPKIAGSITQAVFETPSDAGDGATHDGSGLEESAVETFSPPGRNERMTTVTIEMPQNFADRLAAGPPDTTTPDNLLVPTNLIAVGGTVRNGPSTGSGPAQSTVPAGRFSRPGPDRIRKQPFRGGLLSNLPPTPRSDQTGQGPLGSGQLGPAQLGPAQSGPTQTGQGPLGPAQFGQWRPVTEEIVPNSPPPSWPRAE